MKNNLHQDVVFCSGQGTVYFSISTSSATNSAAEKTIFPAFAKKCGHCDISF